jgi:hypothetical protein
MEKIFMKLTNKQIRQLIREELENVLESQKDVGLPHKYTDMELYHHALNFLQSNPDLKSADPEVKHKGNKLLRILHNAAQKAVQHQEYRQGDFGAFSTGDVEAYEASLGKETTPEETTYMREVQGKLKMARNAMAHALGHRHDYSGRSAAFGDMIRAADPTGEKQRSGLRPDEISDQYHDAIGKRYGKK